MYVKSLPEFFMYGFVVQEMDKGKNKVFENISKAVDSQNKGCTKNKCFTVSLPTSMLRDKNSHILF